MARTPVRGIRELRQRLGRISRETRVEVERAIQRGALAIESRAVQGIIDPPKSGRIYRSKHRKGALHQASAPGQFPAADSGRLHQSITNVDASSGDVIRRDIGANAPYATALELGTSKMAPRPFMQPAFDENVAAVSQSIQAAIRRGSRTR